MPRQLNAGYTAFYKKVALYPEVGRYRRFAANWSKRLYDDTEEVVQKEYAVNKALEAKRRPGCGVTILDVPRSIAIEENPEIQREWDDYEDALTKHGQNLWLSSQILNLPHHDPYATRYLCKWKGLFNNKDEFGPTGEDGALYKDPSPRTDTCAWRTPPQTDMLSTFFINNAEWFQINVINRIKRPFRRQRHLAEGEEPNEPDEPDIPYDRIVMVVDAVVCIFAPVLLDVEMFALVAIKPLTVRIAIVGVFGVVFALSVKGFAGHLSRGEVFAITAAYFAVASVFVGTTSDNISGQ